MFSVNTTIVLILINTSPPLIYPG